MFGACLEEIWLLFSAYLEVPMLKVSEFKLLIQFNSKTVFKFSFANKVLENNAKKKLSHKNKTLYMLLHVQNKQYNFSSFSVYQFCKINFYSLCI